MLSKYKTLHINSLGRNIFEKDDKYRTCYQRDRDRIIHTGSFRKLRYKTQVFVSHEGDYYRDRLTHTVEVVQIARSIGDILGLDTHLIEAVALAHDLGHAPFGHAGEKALDDCMVSYGGRFDHNIQALKVVTELEVRYPKFNGLNLSWETIDGILKHNGPINDAETLKIEILQDIISKYNIEVNYCSGLESQVAAIADDIAYNAHDIDDGLRSGMFSIDKIVSEVGILQSMFSDIMSDHPNLEKNLVRSELVRRVINYLVYDIVENTMKFIKDSGIEDVNEITKKSENIVVFSPDALQNVKAINEFLNKHMYKSSKVLRMMGKCQKMISDLFYIFMEKPNLLPNDWYKKTEEIPTHEVVCDFIAGMTDRFVTKEYKSLFVPYL